MTATALLTQARADGVTLRLEAPVRLMLAGDAQLLAKWAPILRPHKTGLLGILATEHEADIHEAVDERAAIIEVDGHLPRARALEVAELAGAYYAHHWSCPVCRAGTQVGAKLHRPCPDGAELWAGYAEAAGGKT